MTGLIITDPLPLDRRGIPFQVGDEDLRQKHCSIDPGTGFSLVLVVDGEEREAVLWGLEQWPKPGPQVPPVPHAREGVWVAYHSDWSGAQVFLEEIEALRYAVDNHCSVKFWNFGQDKPT